MDQDFLPVPRMQTFCGLAFLFPSGKRSAVDVRWRAASTVKGERC
ncbi:hypothetical protein BRPE64_ECDS01690 (plasmid) [Caballeronia insecticola]|uniref:Uncharacterized protein n=1 Tax=Caballeronia insecticola TaxID=758793 RepID=A0A060PKF2_9BURK|nr:hypothetical protein BRPE64_ECDS01690 [Caballeronia insecticola]